MDGRRQYRICPHCDKELNLKKFREHKRLYYDCDAKQWCKQERKDCSSDESELSGFEFEDIDRSEDISGNNQPEKEPGLDFDECFAAEGMNVHIESTLNLSMANSEGTLMWSRASITLACMQLWTRGGMFFFLNGCGLKMSHI